MNKKELEQLLFDNFFDEFTRSINISGLDFTRFECGVNVGHMKVSAYLYQDNQEANFINQSGCKARVRIYQSGGKSEVVEQRDIEAEVIYIDNPADYHITKLTNGTLELTKKQTMVDSELNNYLNKNKNY